MITAQIIRVQADDVQGAEGMNTWHLRLQIGR